MNKEQFIKTSLDWADLQAYIIKRLDALKHPFRIESLKIGDNKLEINIITKRGSFIIKESIETVYERLELLFEEKFEYLKTD